MSAPVPDQSGAPAGRVLGTPTFAHRVEYALLRAFIGALAPCGVRTASRIAGIVGTWGYSPFGIRRGVVERQIAAAFPAFVL